MKILLAQINPIVGDLIGNSKKIINALNKYKAELYVFPELSIVGYIPQDLLLKKQFITDNLKALKNLVGKTKGKTIIVGFVDRIEGNIFNAAAIINDKKLSGIYHKQCLPNYHIFDEKRWFIPGSSSPIFHVHNKKIGINICEDIWFKETCMAQAKAGTELIINISASPYRANKIKTIEKVLTERYKENKIPIIYVNQVGAQDGILFYGHSMFVNKGKINACKDFVEDVMVVEI